MELKSCPFCNGKAKSDNSDTCAAAWIKCNECGAESQPFARVEEAMAAWNTRANNLDTARLDWLLSDEGDNWLGSVARGCYRLRRALIDERMKINK